MAYADPTRLASGAAVAGAPSDLFARLAERLARWGAYRKSLDELEALDDRTLADLGWNRGALPGMARRVSGL